MCCSSRAQQQTAPVQQSAYVGTTPKIESETTGVQTVEVHVLPGRSHGVMDVENVKGCMSPQHTQNGHDEQPYDTEDDEEIGILTVDEASEESIESGLNSDQAWQNDKRPGDPEKEDHKPPFITNHGACGNSSLRDTVEKKNFDRTVKCKYCKSVCKNISNLYHHVRSKHSEEEGVDDYLGDLKAGRVSTCGMCQKQYSSSKQLEAHIRLMHQHQDQVKCSLCDIIVKSKSHLKNHMKRSHTVQKQEFLCHLCPASFRNQPYLNDHLKHVHSNNTKGSHVCNQCDYSTNSLKYLRGHQFRVHSGCRHVCQYCQKAFTLVPNLKRHIELVHSEVKKRFTCSECSKAFSTKANLKEHFNSIHLKVFTYKCGLCDMGFRRQKELKVHNEVHKTNSTQLQDLITNLDVQNVTKMDDVKETREAASTETAATPENMSEEIPIGDCITAGLTPGQMAKDTDLQNVQLIFVTPHATGQM